MEESANRLLLRWCRDGSATALEELFDLTAPRLLRVAIHLVGDVAEAEDLVQATFVAAIEGRERVDPERPAMPWLLGILSHKASDVRRKRAREIDPDRLAERLSEDASVPAEEKELSGILAEAIDRLEEPYRQLLLLRIRHGMALGDIAHVLGRSPGTVRVQLHRATRKLRDLVPASLMAGLAGVLLASTARGLPAVKAAVVQKASLAAAASGAAFSTTVIGAWIVNQKIVIAGAAALALVFLAVWRFDVLSPLHSDSTTAEPGGATLTAEEVSSPRSADETSPEELRTALLEDNDSGGLALSIAGRVVDGISGDPIAGARLALYPPRRASLMDAMRTHPELYEVHANGEARGRTWANWPNLGELSAAERFGARELTLYDVFNEEGTPLAACVSLADGTFELSAPEQGGLLVCDHADYARRLHPVRESEQDRSISMFQDREFSGRVLFAPDHPPAEPLTLAISGQRMAPVTLEAGEIYSPSEQEIEGLGIWTVTTDASGNFSVRVAAESVMAEVLDEGWRVQATGIYPVDQPATISVVPIPVLHFFDSVTGDAVERVHLLGREQNNSYVRWSGEFHAPGGRLTLPGGGSLLQWHAKDTLSFTAWATGYLGTRLSVTDLAHQTLVEVPLEKGQLGVLRGTVRSSGAACVDTEVALLGHSPLQWREDEDTLIEATLTDAGGRFQMEVPEGNYIARVSAGESDYFELVHVPGPDLDLELAATGRIDVEVIDSDGVPREEHVVVLSGKDGRQLWSSTDARGRCSFGLLPPAQFTVMAPDTSTTSSFAADQMAEVELTRGEQRHVRIKIPALSGPRHARVVAGGTKEYSDWRARYGADPWQALASDGTVPMDLTTEAHRLEIVAPDARRWSLPVPKSAPDGHVIDLDMGQASYRGVLLDTAGAPLAGKRIFAAPWGRLEGVEARVTVSCVSGADGGFHLPGLLPVIYRFEFREDTENIQSYDYASSYKGMSFLPDEKAGSVKWLEIRLTQTPSPIRIHGRVLRESDGTPLAGATLFFDCIESQGAGGLRHAGDRSVIHSGAAGEFEILLPRTSVRTVKVFSRQLGNQALLTEVIEDTGAAEEPALELIVP